MEKAVKIEKPRGVARLVDGRCVACGERCLSVCPANAIDMDEQGAPIIDGTRCSGCVKCVNICPAGALEIYFSPEAQKILDELTQQKGGVGAETMPGEEESAPLQKMLAAHRGVWVVIEQTDGEAAKVSWELLGSGANLAKELKVELCAVVIGSGIQHLCGEAFAYGADKVYLHDAPVYRHYRTQPYKEAICHLIDKYKPEVILMGATGLGRDLAGAVATEVKTGLTADCTGLSIDGKRHLMQTRPAFGGNIMATIMCDACRPQMATVRPHVMSMPGIVKGRAGIIVREDFAPVEENILTKVLEVIRNRNFQDHLDIAGAEFIVSGGRGMLNRGNFILLQQLANEIGAAVGASRSAVDAGWMPHDRQVGQTGKTVRPKLYIACGISGAIQHMVGLQDSDIIIAINRDKDAPIFQIATYGIIGDLFQIVPALTRRLRELRKAAGRPERTA